MPDPKSLSLNVLAGNDETHLRLERTVAAIDWNALASLARSLLGATSSQWGDQLSGGPTIPTIPSSLFVCRIDQMMAGPESISKLSPLKYQVRLRSCDT